MKDLKILVYNFENFFITVHPDQPFDSEIAEESWQALNTSVRPMKPFHKIKVIADMILELKPDLVFCTEIGGQESMDFFIRHFLKEKYQFFSTPSNSDRGIDIGFLLTQSLEGELKSFSHEPLGPSPEERFSRGCLRLSLKSKNKIFCDAYVVHLKSHLTSDPEDPHGFDQRKKEVEALVKIYQANQIPGRPVLIGGDFNGQAGQHQTHQEFLSLKNLDIKDSFDLLQMAYEKRGTHLFINDEGQAQRSQLDYLFVGQEWHDSLVKDQCYVYHYQNEMPEYKEKLASTWEEKRKLPSDHFPVVVTVAKAIP